MDLFMDPQTIKLIYRYSILRLNRLVQELHLQHLQKVCSIFGREQLIGQESKLCFVTSGNKWVTRQKEEHLETVLPFSCILLSFNHFQCRCFPASSFLQDFANRRYVLILYLGMYVLQQPACFLKGFDFPNCSFQFLLNKLPHFPLLKFSTAVGDLLLLFMWEC